jgi:hypothetical protein
LRLGVDCMKRGTIFNGIMLVLNVIQIIVIFKDILCCDIWYVGEHEKESEPARGGLTCSKNTGAEAAHSKYEDIVNSVNRNDHSKILAWAGPGRNVCLKKIT